jgi:hypothetical protein
MLGLLLVAGVASVVGVWGLVDQVNSTARQLRHESAISAALQTAVVAHEEVAHQLLSDERVDRTAFVRAQQSISDQFTEAITVFPPQRRSESDGGRGARVVAARLDKLRPVGPPGGAIAR